ncbi:MAG: hypothetical protein ABFS56_31150 [Pseudomonadota bacterium]
MDSSYRISAPLITHNPADFENIEAPPPAPQALSEAAEVSEPEPVVEKEEEVVFDEPWIDSVLCTTCNDCLNINTMMFVYNRLVRK